MSRNSVRLLSANLGDIIRYNILTELAYLVYNDSFF